MTALLLQVLFAAGAALALFVMYRTVQHYGSSVLALRRSLREGPEVQNVYVQVREIAVTQQRRILRPNFTRRVPAVRCGLRAAA